MKSWHLAISWSRTAPQRVEAHDPSTHHHFVPQKTRIYVSNRGGKSRYVVERELKSCVNRNERWDVGEEVAQSVFHFWLTDDSLGTV